MRGFVDLLIAFQGEPAWRCPTRALETQSVAVFSTDTATMICSKLQSAVPGLVLHQASVGDWQVWGLGEMFQYSGRRQTTAACLDAFACDLAEGRAEPSSLNGHYLVFALDRRTGDWHAWTDRFGTLHAYHSSDGNRAAIGTFHPAVASAASRRRLDWQAITGFFGFGFFPHDRTYFDDVRILRPASHYVFDSHGALKHQEPYWKWRYDPDSKRSYDDTVAAFHEVFTNVMRDLLSEGRIAIPISGGLDSRTALAATKDCPGNRLWSYSYGYADDSVETRIARRLAQARSLRFEAFTVTPYLFEHLDQVLAAVEGFQDVTQSRQTAIAAELGQNADFVIGAHWGDVVLDDMGLTHQGPVDEDSLVIRAQEKMEKRGHSWLLDHLCPVSRLGAKPGPVLRQFVRDGLAPLGHLECPDFRLKAYKSDAWSFRWTTASLRAYQAGAFPRLPFYDNRVRDFISTVPREFVQGRRLQIDVLKRFAPDLARVTWQAYDADLYHYQHFGNWQLPKRALKKGWRLLTGKKVFERNWEVQFLNKPGREGLKTWLLRPGLRLHEFVAPAKVQDLLDAFYARPLECGRGYTVSMLLTFSSWLERFG